jgi:hypothetical protein
MEARVRTTDRWCFGHRVAILRRIACTIGRPSEQYIRGGPLGGRELPILRYEIPQDERCLTRIGLGHMSETALHSLGVEERQRSVQCVGGAGDRASLKGFGQTVVDETVFGPN